MLADHHVAIPIEAHKYLDRGKWLVLDALPNGNREHYHAIQSPSLRMIARD